MPFNHMRDLVEDDVIKVSNLGLTLIRRGCRENMLSENDNLSCFTKRPCEPKPVSLTHSDKCEPVLVLIQNVAWQIFQRVLHRQVVVATVQHAIEVAAVDPPRLIKVIVGHTTGVQALARLAPVFPSGPYNGHTLNFLIRNAHN